MTPERVAKVTAKVPIDERKTNRWLSAVSLFTSMSTLICCALPALFVALGMGAALAGLIGAVPQIVWFSEHKLAVFGLAGACLIANGIVRYRTRNAYCPTDRKLADACARTRRWTGRIYAASIAAYLVGGFFAFVAPNL